MQYNSLNDRLNAFSDFNFETLSSWSELELFATACGVELDVSLISALYGLSDKYKAVSDAFMSELADRNGILANSINSVEFVNSVYNTWSTTQLTPDLRLSIDAQLKSFHLPSMTWAWSADTRLKVKYTMFTIIDLLYPYLMLKFYAANSKFLVRNDFTFISWLVRRLEARSNDPNSKMALVALRKEISTHNNISKFMS